MLHIVTPLYRFNLLQKVYQSIPNSTEIIWHLAKSESIKEYDFKFFKHDSRVKLYEIDCKDTDIIAKRNKIFSEINDGYFCMLDDDTIFVKAMFDLYIELKNEKFIGMAIGNQKYGNGIFKDKATMLTQNFKTNYVNTGMVLSHYSVLKHVQYESHQEYKLDCYFWSRCFMYFTAQKTKIVNKDISYFNYFGEKLKVRKKIFGLFINFDIYNPIVVMLYKKISFLGNKYFYTKRKNNLNHLFNN
jgi:hypothetical protein